MNLGFPKAEGERLVKYFRDSGFPTKVFYLKDFDKWAVKKTRSKKKSIEPEQDGFAMFEGMEFYCVRRVGIYSLYIQFNHYFKQYVVTVYEGNKPSSIYSKSISDIIQVVEFAQYCIARLLKKVNK